MKKIFLFLFFIISVNSFAIQTTTFSLTCTAPKYVISGTWNYTKTITSSTNIGGDLTASGTSTSRILTRYSCSYDSIYGNYNCAQYQKAYACATSGTPATDEADFFENGVCSTDSNGVVTCYTNPPNGFYDSDGTLYCDDNYENVNGSCYKSMENGYLNDNGNLECHEGFFNNGDYCVPNQEPETNDCASLQSQCESTCGGLSGVSSFGCSDGFITTPCSCSNNGSSGTGDTGSTGSGSTGDTGSTGGSGSSGGSGDTGSGSTGDTGSTSGTGSTDSGSGSTDTNSGSTGGTGTSGGTSGSTGDSGSTGGTGTSGGTSGDSSSGDTGSDSGVDLSKLENLSASIKTNTENTSNTLTKILDGLTKDGDTSKTDSLTNEYNSSDSGFTSFYNDMKSSYNNFLAQFDTAKSIFEEGFNFNPIQTYANQNLKECLTIQVFGNHDVTLDYITPLNYLKPIFSIIFQIFMLVEVIRMCFKILKDTRSLF